MSTTSINVPYEAGAPTVVRLSRDAHTVSRSMIDENSLKVLYRLRQHGYLAYLVGGSVRDLLLGRQPKDFDVGTDATPDQVRKLFRNCRLVGRRFRLAHIMFGRDSLIEVATFRRKPLAEEIPDADDGGLLYAENVFGTPQQDSFRRDFTINALFYDIADFSIIDYVGGLDDLRAGVIRVIGDPDERFAEDPVRMLRALEFSARLGFTLEASIPDAIGRCAEQLHAAAPARIREEILELFRHKVAGAVLQKAARFGLLEYLLPNLKAGRQTFDLLRQLDLRTAAGIPVDEYFTLAVMNLEHFAQHVVLDMSIGDVHVLANRLLAGHCRHFSIASGIKHKARELLIAFFRLQRGRGKRGEQRFLHHPATAEAVELYRLWCSATNCGRELLESWQRALAGEEPAGENKNRKKVRRRRKKKPQQSGSQTDSAEKTDSGEDSNSCASVAGDA